MQSVEIKGLDKVIRSLDTLPDVIRQARVEALEAEAEPLLALVQQGIGRGPRRAGDSHMHIADVQSTFMGSGKGYLAVRAKAKTDIVSPRGKRHAAGYVTNALENGHKAAGGGRVGGKYMYANARPAAEDASRRLKEKIEKAVKEHFDDD
ncbi:MAG: hypothetical protein IKB79_04950 [Oscillospiraceae bacterium]|nr:hypothetical protein [Oscillospiraceae bacterium]